MKHVFLSKAWIVWLPLSLTAGVTPALAQHGQPRPAPNHEPAFQHQGPPPPTPRQQQPPQQQPQRPMPAPFARPQPMGGPSPRPMGGPAMRQPAGPPPQGPPPGRGPGFQHQPMQPQGPPPGHGPGFQHQPPPPPHQGPSPRTGYSPPPPPPPAQVHAWHSQAGWRQQGGGWPEHRSWQEHRAQHWEHDHRTWGQRGGYGGRYIPERHFYRHFGHDHWFRIRSRPTIYMGYPRFQYGGYGFLVVDPWPESWADDWYRTDDVYVDYDNGYYLYNRRDPGIAIALTVVP